MKLRIRKIRQAMGLTLEQLATTAGISRSYLNELELGAKTINANRLDQVARALSVRVEDLIDREPVPIAVAGRVGAGARIPLVDGFEKGSGLFHVACPPQLPVHNIAAVEVVGDSMMPAFSSGSVLFFTRHAHEGVLDEDIGRTCIIEDSEGNAWVKLLKRGSEPGLFNLVSLNPTSESAWDQRVKWAARVRMSLPEDLVERLD
ncbi:XRE family transcriptional regulator [Roseinatronobacter sp. NSM]|uniref:XRE family transcriptional regulator n=1 Tax=Roseinatronobacter sp. NSM TaxID=3457785 RepID=UPI00403514FF